MFFNPDKDSITTYTKILGNLFHRTLTLHISLHVKSFLIKYYFYLLYYKKEIFFNAFCGFIRKKIVISRINRRMIATSVHTQHYAGNQTNSAMNMGDPDQSPQKPLSDLFCQLHRRQNKIQYDEQCYLTITKNFCFVEGFLPSSV